MASALALILASLAAGHLAARLGWLAGRAADRCNAVVIYVCLPALVLRLVPKLSFRRELLTLAISPWLGALCCVALVLIAARRLKLARPVTAALLLCAPLGNTSFLGFPLVDALLGTSAVAYAVVFDQLGSFLILSTYGLYVLARASGAAPSLRSTLLRIVKFPPFLALLAALVPVHHPAPFERMLVVLGSLLVPLAMFAVGLRLELRRPRDLQAFALGLLLKMVIMPLVVFAFCKVAGTHGLPARVAVLEAAMPPMITAGALATLAGFAPELSSALVAYGVLLSLVTLPLLSMFVKLSL